MDGGCLSKESVLRMVQSGDEVQEVTGGVTEELNIINKTVSTGRCYTPVE